MPQTTTHLFPQALTAPPTDNTVINESLIKRVIIQSRKSPRKRVILPFHKNEDAVLHRMLNGLQPGSYIRPHRHYDPPKAESVIVLRGAILALLFNREGGIDHAHRLVAGAGDFGIDSEAGVFHTFLALKEDTVLFEVKPGPYHKSSDKDFAPWAPEEGTKEVKEYLEYLYRFAAGQG